MCNAAKSHAFLRERAEAFAMYGEPFIDLVTGQRLRTFTDVAREQRPLLTRIRALFVRAEVLTSDSCPLTSVRATPWAAESSFGRPGEAV